MSRTVDAAKREAWRLRLARWERDDWSVAEFCRREGVSVPSFYYWKRRVGARAMAAVKPRGAMSPAARLSQKQPAFVQVQISEPAARGAIEVELTNGALLRVPLEIESRLLREIIQAAGELGDSSGTPSGGLPC